MSAPSPALVRPADEHARARLTLLAAAVCFSTGGAAVKATSFSGLQVAGLRSALAVALLVGLFPAARRLLDRRVLLVGVAYAAMMLLFVTSNKLTTAANAIFLQSTFPVWVVLLGPWLLGETVRRTDLLALAVTGGGVALLATGEDPASAVATDPALGDALAAASGLGWGLVVLGLRWLARDGGGEALAATAAGNALAAVAALALGWPWEAGTAADWAPVLWLGFVQVGLAYVLMTRAMRRLGALESSLLLLAEPALSPLWAWWLHGERPSGTALGGGALILGGLIFRTVGASRALDAARRS